MRKILTVISVIFFISISSSAFSWTENTLVPPETASGSGANDSMAGPALLGSYGGGLLSGTGYISNNSDTDRYKLTVPATENNPNHELLKVSLFVPGGPLLWF